MRSRLFFVVLVLWFGGYSNVGVNTFLSKDGSPTILPTEVIRSTTKEKEAQINSLNAFKERHKA